MIRSNFFFLLLCILILISCSKSEEEKDQTLPLTKTKPNIIWIVIDSLRADVIGKYNVTPNLEEFLDTSNRYDFHLVNAAWTRPSTIVFFTGKYASRSPVNFWDYPTPKEEAEQFYKTEKHPLPKYLEEHGYKTWMVGNNPFLSDKNGLGVNVGFSHLFDFSNYSEDTVKITNKTILLFETELSKLKEPFFYFLNYNDPHKPYTPPLGYVDRLDPNLVLDERKRNYLGEVAFVDDELGKVFKKIKELGLWDHSIILITADHGEVMEEKHAISPFTGTNTYYGHGQDLFLENIHVPLLIKYPNQTLKKKISSLTRSIDLYPTILETAGLPIPSDLDGISLLSLNKEDVRENRPYYGETRSTQCYGEGNEFLLQRSFRFHEIGRFWQGSVGNEFYMYSDIQKDPNQIEPIRIPEMNKIDSLNLSPNEKTRIVYLWKKLRSLEPKLPIYSVRYMLYGEKNSIQISVPFGKIRILSSDPKLAVEDFSRSVSIHISKNLGEGTIRFEVYPDVSFPKFVVSEDGKKVPESEFYLGNFGLSGTSCFSNCEMLYDSFSSEPPTFKDSKVHIWKQGGQKKDYERRMDLGIEALTILKKQGYVQ